MIEKKPKTIEWFGPICLSVDNSLLNNGAYKLHKRQIMHQFNCSLLSFPKGQKYKYTNIFSHLKFFCFVNSF